MNDKAEKKKVVPRPKKKDEWRWLRGEKCGHGPRRRYRYRYEDVAALRGVGVKSCRRWFYRRGWHLDRNDPVGSLKMVVRYALEAEGARLRVWAETDEEREKREGLRW